MFIAGTSTPTNSYTDSTGSVANPNPVVLDSTGTASIWLKAGAYKLVVKTAGSVTVQTVDNITFPYNQFTNGLFTSKFNGVFYMDGNKYPRTTAGVQQILADGITAGAGMVDAAAAPP